MISDDYVKSIEERLESVEHEIKEINRKLDMQKGFIGGIVFIISAIWSVFLSIKSYLNS